MVTQKDDFDTRLRELRSRHCDQMPTPELAVLVRLTARLRRSGIVDRCLQVGESAPDFEFIESGGERAHLYGLLERGPVVVNFFRGLWCPWCRTELEAYADVQERLAALGCGYLAVGPDIPAGGAAPSWPNIVFDRDNAIARRYGLVYTLNEEETRLFRQWGVSIAGDPPQLPMPATYLIGPDRTVAFRFLDVDFRARCCPEDLLTEAESLVS